MELAFQTISPTFSNTLFHRSPLSIFPSNLRRQFQFHAVPSSVTSSSNQLLSSHNEIEFNQDEIELQLVEEDDEDGYRTSSFLSLSSKPDRNMAMLDDYEMEELGYSHDPNHRSGI